MLSPSAYSLTFDSSAPITSADRVTSPASDVWASLPSPLAGLRMTRGQLACVKGTRMCRLFEVENS